MCSFFKRVSISCTFRSIIMTDKMFEKNVSRKKVKNIVIDDVENDMYVGKDRSLFMGK